MHGKENAVCLRHAGHGAAAQLLPSGYKNVIFLLKSFETNCGSVVS
jgi:hypothetical protein